MPTIEGLQSTSSRYWELSDWMPGRPAAADASAETISRGAAVIAQFHRSVEELCQNVSPVPAVAARLRRLSQLRVLLPQMRRRSESFAAHDSPRLRRSVVAAARQISHRWASVDAEIVSKLSEFESLPLPTQYVLRDIHRDHLLFEDLRPSGLIDFDAVRVDSPAADLARWVERFLIGRTREQQESVWQAAMAGFVVKNVFKDSQQQATEEPVMLRLAKSLHFATQWISLANWLVWVVCEEREFPAGQSYVAGRIEELIESTSLTRYSRDT